MITTNKNTCYALYLLLLLITIYFAINWQEVSIWIKLGLALIYIKIIVEEYLDFLKRNNKNPKFVKITGYIDISVTIILLLVIVVDASALWNEAGLGFKIGSIMIIISISGMTLLTLLVKRKKVIKGS